MQQNQQALQNILACCVGAVIFAGVPLGTIAVRNTFFPPVPMATVKISPCTNIKCEEDDEEFDIDWLDTKVVVEVKASTNVIAVSDDKPLTDPSGEKFYTTVTVTGRITGGPPAYNTDDYEYVRTEWKLSVSGLEFGEIVSGEHDVWQDSEDLECTMYGTSPNDVTVSGTAAARYFFRKKAIECDDCSGSPAGEEFLEDVPGTERPSGSSAWEEYSTTIRRTVGNPCRNLFY